MFKVVGKYWNADFDIISDGKDFYVLNEYGWNGEKWFDCWKVLDKKGLKKSDDKSSYTIKPIYKEIDTDDFEIIDYEVSEDAKLTGKYEYRKDGNKHLKGYSISLAKTKVEEAGFDINSDIDIIYKKNKIEITKKEQK